MYAYVGSKYYYIMIMLLSTFNIIYRKNIHDRRFAIRLSNKRLLFKDELIISL